MKCDKRSFGVLSARLGRNRLLRVALCRLVETVVRYFVVVPSSFCERDTEPKYFECVVCTADYNCKSGRVYTYFIRWRSCRCCRLLDCVII